MLKSPKPFMPKAGPVLCVDGFCVGKFQLRRLLLVSEKAKLFVKAYDDSVDCGNVGKGNAVYAAMAALLSAARKL